MGTRTEFQRIRDMSPNREIPQKIKKGGVPFQASALLRSNKVFKRSVPAAAAAEAASSAARAGPGFPAPVLARPGTIGPGPGLDDRQRTALEVLAIQSGNGLVGLFLVRHLDEAETAALAVEPDADFSPKAASLIG